MGSKHNLNSVISWLWCQSPDKLSKLSSLNTNQERIDYVYSEHIFDNAFDIVLNGKSAKSAKLSEKFRMEGNKMFKLERYAEALNLYNKSVLLAPFPPENGTGDECAYLAVAFGNRSATLYHLSKYSHCIKDIEYSLELGYPASQMYKLYNRAGRCHLALSQLQEAKKAFQCALVSLEQSALQSSNRQKWALSIQKEMKMIPKPEDDTPDSAVSKDSQHHRIPALMGDTHIDLPNASSSVSLDQNEALGRFMTANSRLQIGDVVFSEKPYAAVLHEDVYKSYCFWCHVAVSLPFPCQRCSEVIYCSRQCQSESWPIHCFECTNLSLLTEDFVYKLGHVALRAIISAPRHMLGSSIVLESGCEVKTNYGRFCQLVTHEKDRDPNSNLQLISMAAYLTKVLTSLQFVKDLEEKMICWHILHALQVVQCNGITVNQMSNADNFENSKPQPIGQAVCLTLALVNHSCDPNMELCFYGNHCVVRTLKTVDVGQVISYDYGTVFTVDPKTKRLKYLRDNYYFTCGCVACLNDWPVFGKLNSTELILKCQSCHQPLPVVTVSNMLTCSQCGEQLSARKTIMELSQSHDKYALAFKQASRGELLEALPSLVGHLELLDKFICPPWKEYYSCQTTVRQCYRLLAAKYGQNLEMSC